jgi:cobalt-zinc-cadmium efflux system outer membrane protein
MPGLRNAAIGLALGAAACASTSPERPVREVADNVEARSGHRLRWNGGTSEDAEVERAIDQLLAGELTVDSAVEVALLGSPALQAKLEELSIAQADLVQAGLLKNPVFAIGRTAWDHEHIDPNIFVSLEQSFLELLTLPLKKRLAATELEAAKLSIADDVLEVAAATREAFYTAQAAAQVLAMRRLVEEASQTSAELARRQHDAGTMNDLTLSTQLSLAVQATLDRRRAESEAAVARERLNKRMGVWGPRTAWRTGSRLPDVPAEEPELDHLESVAIAQRFDVGAARRNLEALEYAVGLAKTTRWTGTLMFAVEAGRLRGSKHYSFGPSVAIELPLFDQRQAQIARLDALRRQADDELRSLAIDVRADVRAGAARLTTARALVLDYARVVVPLREKVVRFSQQQYDAMLLGVYQLIQAKQSEFEAYREAIEALRDYWIARSDLERTIGGRLTSPPKADPKATTAPPSPPNHPHP